MQYIKFNAKICVSLYFNILHACTCTQVNIVITCMKNPVTILQSVFESTCYRCRETVSIKPSTTILVAEKNSVVLFSVTTEKVIHTCKSFSSLSLSCVPLSSPHDPAVSERHSGGGSWAGCAPNLRGHRRFPLSHSDVVALPRSPSPQRPGSRANADFAGRHTGRRRLLQLHGCQQCGQPSSQERQCHCQE